MATQWYFRDRANQVQGPFGDDEMRAWYEAGYLQSDLLISNGHPSQVQMKPLQVWFPNGTVAFVPREQLKQMDPVVAAQWYFVDKNQKVQGPFSDMQMHQWHSAGYFAGDLQIVNQAVQNAQWQPLRAVFPNVSEAFLTGGGAGAGAGAGGAKATAAQQQKQQQQDLATRFQFPEWLPVPPGYKGVKKIYPSEQGGTKKGKVNITDVNGQSVRGFGHTGR